MPARSGKCVNFGLCAKADSREVIAAEAGDFQCPECGKPLTEAGKGGGSGAAGGGRGKVLILAAIAIALLGGGLYFLLFAPSGDEVAENSAGQVPPPDNGVAPPGNNPPPATNPPTDKAPPVDNGPGVPPPPTEPFRERGVERARENPSQRPSPVAPPEPERPRPQRREPAPVEAPAAPLDKVIVNATLMSPINTKTSREGDTFTAKIADGPYRGGILTGRITKIEKKKKNAEVAFQFDTLSFQGKTRPITADLKDVENTMGAKGVDEEGHVIGHTSKKKSMVMTGIGAGVGAVVGAITGGGKGAAIGAGAGAAAGLVMSLTLTSRAEDINFVPGTRFSLELSERASKK